MSDQYLQKTKIFPAITEEKRCLDLQVQILQKKGRNLIYLNFESYWKMLRSAIRFNKLKMLEHSPKSPAGNKIKIISSKLKAE